MIRIECMFLIITAKPKISTIYPVQENMLTVKTTSVFPTFLSQRNASNITLICIGHGLPSPNLEWQKTSGVKLNTSFSTHFDGVVSAVLVLNKLLSSVTAVQCVALSNETIMDKQTVWIEVVTDSLVQQTSVLSHTAELLTTNFAVRLLLKHQSYCATKSVSVSVRMRH